MKESFPAARNPPLRRWLHQARKQGSRVRTMILVVYLPLILLYAALALHDGSLIVLLLRDENSMADTGLFYQGALSSLGVLLWWAAAAISAFAAILIGRTGDRYGYSSRAFFRYFAIFTGILALDDLFMLHEEALPNYLGIPEWGVYAGYGLLTLGFIRFIPLIFRTDFVLLAFGFGFFALSVLTDVGLLHLFFDMSGGSSLVLEDLSKVLGIVSWLGYALRAALKVTLRHLVVPEALRPAPHPKTKLLALRDVTLKGVFNR